MEPIVEKYEQAKKKFSKNLKFVWIFWGAVSVLIVVYALTKDKMWLSIIQKIICGGFLYIAAVTMLFIHKIDNIFEVHQ